MAKRRDAGAAAGATAEQAIQWPLIGITNESTLVSDADVQDLIAALQIQVVRDFARYWGRHFTSLSFLPKTSPVPDGMWQLVIADDSNQAGALGYHELTANGDPIGFAFVKDTMDDGLDWHVTASHELLEMIADPGINMSAEVDDASGNASFYAFEACDATEDDQFGYQIDIGGGKQILVSDFVTPNWFSPIEQAKGPFDLGNHTTAPLQLLQNGYISVYKAGWTQLNGTFDSPAKAKRAVPTVGHRRYRRTLPRAQWKRSAAK